MGAVAEVHVIEQSAKPARGAAPAAASAATVGIVVIGRDLGARLGRSLSAAAASGLPSVYVDSGSRDSSVHEARSRGIPDLALDPGTPFTAARGRNEGFAHLKRTVRPEFVMFVDGDVELAPTFLKAAENELKDSPGVAIVTGHLRERDRDSRTLARVCDMDWSGPVGDIGACGGIFMARAEAFERVGGFDATIPTGEEAELCARLRRDGWAIRRIDEFMGEHDAAMTSFAQWWSRTARVGEGYVAAARRPGASRDRAKRRRIASNVAWGLIMPGAALACAAVSIVWPWALAGVATVLVLYVLLWLRIARTMRRRGRPRADARLYATFCLLAKWAHLAGHVRAWARGGAS